MLGDVGGLPETHRKRLHWVLVRQDNLVLATRRFGSDRAIKAGAMAKPYIDVVEERYGKDVRDALQNRWQQAPEDGLMVLGDQCL